MSFAAKRRLYESAPLWMRRAVGALPFGLVAGAAYRGVVRRAARFERASAEEIRAYQEEKLGEMLRFATEEVPAYRSQRGAVERLRPFEALRAFPLLGRTTLQERMCDYLPRSLDRIPRRPDPPWRLPTDRSARDRFIRGP